MKDNEKIAAPYVLTEQELEIMINDRVLEELEQIAELAKPLRYSDKHDVLLDRTKELKQ